MKKLLRRWLEIKDPDPKLQKDLEKKVDKLLKDLEFWHRKFRTYSFVPCAHCGKKLMVWPYETGAYYHDGNKRIHVDCYGEYKK